MGCGVIAAAGLFGRGRGFLGVFGVGVCFGLLFGLLLPWLLFFLFFFFLFLFLVVADCFVSAGERSRVVGDGGV
jgi:hypothetical protein